ncbi:MAG: diguanylate cyclase/phosphodiesterase with sensor(s) [Proteobacteria bacterium]|nr:diguanylate cyclase/phosphodiesterase with sensor(s) [Pseudomonadota bacterium]
MLKRSFPQVKKPGQFRWALILGVLLLNLLVISVAVIELEASQREREQEVQTSIQNLSLSLDREIASAFDKLDLGLQNMTDIYADLSRAARFDSAAWNAALLRQRARHVLLNGLRATDAAGNVVYGLDASANQGARIADRDYFRRLRDEPAAGLVISPPLLSRTTGVWVIVLARRLETPAGRFAGVTYATVPLDQFRQMFAALTLGAQDSIAFRDGELRLLARHPALPGPGAVGQQQFSTEFKAALQKNPDAGSYMTGVSSIDGIQRLHSYRRNARYGYYINVGFSSYGYLEVWRGDLRRAAAFVFLFMIATVLFAWRILHLSRQQMEAFANLQRSESQFRLLFANMTEGMALHALVFAADGRPLDYRIVDVNPAYEKHTGLAAAQVVGRLASAVYGMTPAPYLERYARVAETGEPAEFEASFKPLGKRFRVLAYGAQAGQFVAVFEDITARHAAEEGNRLMAKVFAESNEAIIISDAANRIVTVNAAFTRLTGYPPEEVIGQDPRLLSAGTTGPETYAQMWRELASRGCWQGELQDRRKDGAIYPKWLSISVARDPQGRISNYIGSFVDISERKASEERVRHLALHDPLTGLLNRFSLQERLAQALGFARRNDKRLAVMLIDLDRFKTINDTLGHPVGDQLLVQVAERLGKAVRDSDIVARLGGDEFVIVLPEIESPSAAAHVAEKIVKIVSQPYLIGEREQRTAPSIGICLFPDDATDGSELIKKADVAMYHAKAQGRATYRFFTTGIQAVADQRMAIETELRTALEQQQFLLHYQPQLDLRSGQLVGVEALVRWQHPQRGLVPPLEFIPVAEETGMIIELGNWVLHEGCRQLGAWCAGGMSGIRLSVNLSAAQFLDRQLPARINAWLEEYGLQPGQLDLEVTESMSMASPEATIASMNELTGLGLSLSIDDFGTGYSSLAYLKLFPISTLKIDRSFVKDIETDQNDADICDVTVLLAHKLGLDVVAEGVETDAQLRYLHSIGCEKIQGYLISKPLPADQVEAFIRHYPRLSGLGSVELWEDG